MILPENVETILSIADKYGLSNVPAKFYLLPQHQSRLTILKGIGIAIGQPIEKEGCSICISDTLKRLKQIRTQYKRDTMTAKKNKSGKKSLYVMKERENTVFKGAYLNAGNLTDDLARELLMVDPNRIHLFTSYPENWKEDIKKKKVEKVVDSVKKAAENAE